MMRNSEESSVALLLMLTPTESGCEVVVPADCTASNSESLTLHALEQMRVVSNACTDESRALDLGALRAGPKPVGVR